jgi:SAM-dependent methyltransferase
VKRSAPDDNPRALGRAERLRLGTSRAPAAKRAAAVIWHDVECGSYTADLPVWRDLAERAGGPVLELGAGTGRVALDLAGHGHQVTALDADAELLAAAAAAGVVAASVLEGDKVAEAFRTGQGVGWDKRNKCLFCGTARFFRTAYMHHLVQEWLPALDGAIEKLERGAAVADVGCGHGVSTLLMAQAFPNSRFFGFDFHPESIDAARRAAEEAGLGDRVRFEAHSAKTFPGEGYDLVCFFDCLHDMGDPVGAMRHVREAIADDGLCMVVEPFANDRLEDNLNPVGRIYYAASTMVCTPASLDQEVGLALGAQAGEARLREVAREAGFTRFRRATETPFNLVLEARP